MRNELGKRKSWAGAGAIVLAAILVLLSGCSGRSRNGTPTPSPSLDLPPAAPALAAAEPLAFVATPAPDASPAAGTSAATGPAAGSFTAGDHLFVGGSASGPYFGLSVLNATTGAQESTLTAGLPAQDWSVIYSAQQQGPLTQVEALDPAAGESATALRGRQIAGGYQLTGSGLAVTSAGLSPNGRWLALMGTPDVQSDGSFARRYGASNRFVVLDTSFSGLVHGVTLDGYYRFYALSNDGNSLYLLESGPGNQGRRGGQVRVYDVKNGRLLGGPLSDQDGRALALSPRVVTAFSPDGSRLYSLGSGASVMSVYALDLDSRTAQRVDLPGASSQGFAAQAAWSLSVAPGGAMVYAVNSASGFVAEVDMAGSQVRASELSFAAGAAGSASPAAPATATPSGGEALGSEGLTGGSAGPGAGRGGVYSPGGFGGATASSFRRFVLRSAVLAPDGQTLYVPTDGGVAMVNTKGLSLNGYLLQGTPIDSLALSSDGARLYALNTEQHKIVRLDARTGAVVSEIKDVSGVWSLLHVTSAP